MRFAAALLVAAALAGCMDDGGGNLFDMHVGHDFEESPRTHSFATGDEADRLVVHVQLAPKDRSMACDAEEEPGVAITLRKAPNETVVRVARVDPACRVFEEHRIPLEGRALWVVAFEGNGAFLGGVDVTAQKTGTSFRLPRG